MKKTAALAASLCLLLSSCSGSALNQNGTTDSEACNPGVIMQTSEGFYINDDYFGIWEAGETDETEESEAVHQNEDGDFTPLTRLHLWYYDRETKQTSMLCNRLGCPHDGRDTCPATYRSLITGSVKFYEGSVYFTAAEKRGNRVDVSLYRAAGDGSALDRVCTLMSIKAGQDDNYWLNRTHLVIHRGYAFSSFDLTAGNDEFNGYAGGRFVKTDLRTGKNEIITEYSDYWEERPHRIIACDDYIFYSRKNNINHTEHLRMNIHDNSYDVLPVEYADDMYIAAADHDTVYYEALLGKAVGTVTGYNAVTMEKEPGSVKDTNQYGIAAYDDKLMLLSGNTLSVYENGELILSTEDIPLKEARGSIWYRISVSDGKLYFTAVSVKYTGYWSCPVSELAAGNINWTCEFDTDSSDAPCEVQNFCYTR